MVSSRFVRGISLLGVALLVQAGCAAPPTPTGPPTAVAANPSDSKLDPRESLPSGPLTLSPPTRDARGLAYRLVLEMSGERQTSVDGRLEDPPPLHESHLLELEFRELPIRAGHEEAYQVALDGLHYRLLQQNPAADREVELGSDRLRIGADGEEEIDLRGAQPKGDLTPRKLLGRVFGIVVPGPKSRVSVQPRGLPPARRFFSALPLRQAIGYTRLPLPKGEIAPGSSWRAERFPASPAGTLGLGIQIDYTLAGFETLGDVPCAWILLRAEQIDDDVRSAAGFTFDRVVTSLDGMAWVELATSRVHRLVLEDEIRVAYSRSQGPAGVVRNRMRHKSRLELSLRNADETPATWADGSERFGRR